MDDETLVGPSSNDPVGVGAGSLTPPPGNSGMEFKIPPPRPSVDLSGTVLGDYRLVRKVAQGGMGEVYEAIQLKLDRKVALKILTDRLASQLEFLKRFEREAKAAAALNHPNIVQVYDFGEANGRYYLVMEFVEGQDLGNYIKTAGKLMIPDALTVIEEAAAALKAAAEKAIIHRDIKPDNLMRTLSGRIKVSDMGLAKKLTDDSEVTATGIGIGSPHFLSPEQADDAAHVDHRADIYALGITLLYLLTGRHPFSGTSAFAIVMAHANKPLPTGEELGTPLPDEIEALIRRMAAKRPEERYQDYDSLLTDVVRVKTGFLPALEPGGSRSSKQIVFAGIAALLIVGVLIAMMWNGRPPEPSTQSAVVPVPTAPKTSETKTAVQNDPPAEPRGPRPNFAEAGPKAKSQKGMNAKGGVRRTPLALPMPRLPMKNWNSMLKEGSVGEMLAEANAFAAKNTNDVIGMVDRYHVVLLRAEGSPLEKEINLKLENAKVMHDVLVHDALDRYEAKMGSYLRSENPQAAYNVWRDFPTGLRTPEVDQAIMEILEQYMPPAFQPASP